MSERPTPSSICVCCLIVLYADPQSSFQADLTADERQSKHDRIFRLLQALVRQDVAALEPIHQILERVHSVGGEQAARRLWTVLRRAALESIDGLTDLMASMRDAVSLDGSPDMVVDGSSQFGLYIRRICLGYDRLAFETASRLWESLQAAVEDTMREPELLTTQSSSSSSSSSSLWRPSSKQTEELHSKTAMQLDGQQLERDDGSGRDKTVSTTDDAKEQMNRGAPASLQAYTSMPSKPRNAHNSRK